MHGRIYQIIKEPLPDAVCWIDSGDFDCDGYFLREVADYVDDIGLSHYDDEQKTFFDGLTDACSQCVEIFHDGNGDGFILSEGFREKYFEKSYEIFLRALAELNQNVCREAFVKGSLDQFVREMRSALYDKFGSYVICSDWAEDIETLDHFMRYTAEPNVKYYLRNILDYHW
jgi:hypothetical protein